MKFRIRTIKPLSFVAILLVFVSSVIPATCAAEVANHTIDTGVKQNDGTNQPVMIVSGHPNYPPFMWKQKESITGVGVELIRMICAELTIPCDVKWCGPWKRVQKKALEGNIDLIVGLYMNDERGEYLDYTTPYITERVVIAVLKENPFSFKHRRDLIGKMGITIHGDSFGQGFDDYMSSNLQVERAYTIEALFRNILAGHSDYILWGYYSLHTSASRLGYQDKIRIIKTPVVSEDIYMAFSKKSGYRKNLKKVNSILKRFKKNGIVKQLIDKYTLIYAAETGLPVE